MKMRSKLSCLNLNAHRSYLNCLLLIGASGLLCSCVSIPSKVNLDQAGVERIDPATTKSIPDLYIKERETLRNGEAPRIGLALSGGGIRSTLFSIGAMKAIYDYDDGELMSQIDVISSVSGGGYASYWLYLNEMAAEPSGKPFGFATFADDSYEEHVQKLAYRGDMYPWYRLLPQLFVPRKITIKDYEKQIDWTFGQGNKQGRPVTFGDLRRYINDTNAPYPVFNTTIISKSRPGDHPEGSEHPTRIMEFTVNHVGNPEFDQIQRFEQFQDHRVSNVVATSGAAFTCFLYQNYPGWSEHGPKKWPLHDGGKNDNAGVTSLVRRGVDKIIVLDGEHSKNYEFEAYEQMQRNLEAIGMKVSIPDLEAVKNAGYNDRKNPLEKGVFKGFIRPISRIYGIQKEIEVFYVRMAFSEDLFEVDEWITLEKDYAEFRIRGWKKAFCKDRLHELHDPKQCLVTSRSYSDYLTNSKWKRIGHMIPAVNYSFPQMSTFDQGMGKADKSASLLSLGYLQGTKFAELWNTIKD